MQSLLRLLATLVSLAATLLLAFLAAVGAAFYFLFPSLPSPDTMRDVKLQVPLRIYSRDGRLMAQIGEQRRIPVRFEETPKRVIDAFLAAEDDRFFEHPGFDYQGIARAALKVLATGERTQGGSTITQQLARAYFLSPERSFVRKAKELILAVEIEREFTKTEILTLYLNKIFLGQRAYGVAAAAEVYFGKTLDELSVAEAATIAGMPKAPSQLNPVASPARATERRAYVLRRMAELGMITRPEYQDALATPMVSRLHGPRVELDAPYVTEMARAELVNRFGNAAYSDGYKVVTTIDSELQVDANLAMRTAIYEYDRRHGFRGPSARDALAGLRSGVSGRERDQALQGLLERYPGDEDLHPAVVLRVNADNAAELFVRDVGHMRISWEGLRWRPYLTDDSVGAIPKSARDFLTAGDVVHVLHTVNRGWLLSQVPQVQSAFVAMDPKDGATVALSGGFDFYSSNYNRAVQARRQPGSSFKPFIYSAALEHGFTPATLVNDAPLVFGDSELEEEWRPENNSREFNGPTRLREALVRSLNLVSVRVLLGTGVAAAIEHVKAFGFDDDALPHNLSLALGSGGASPWDMATGYCAFANGGYRVTHYFIDRIEDAEGRAVFEATPAIACASCEGAVPPMASRPDVAPSSVDNPPAGTATGPLRVADRSPISEPLGDSGWSGPGPNPTGIALAPRIISAENAFLIYDMMRDVIKRGTGRRARDLGRTDLAGKTGTSNERRDTWFSGFNAELVATAWVGFDQERSLGEREEGSQTALPVWKYFMARALKGVPESPLAQPADLVAARISAVTGRLVPAGAPDAVFELFRPADLAALESGAPAGNSPGVAIGSPTEGTDIF